ncbi:MAG TPA: DUF1214 domain-containing protein [Acidimicrobiia bacterium]|nr:DUF1214 domain-containing protein [Acidimicrobiia bacterium]
MNRAPKSTEAFDELIAALTEIRDGYVLNEDRFTEDIDVVEGYRYVTEVLSGMSEFFVEGDPDHPRMAPIVSPARKLQGDNPDAIYHFAQVRGDRSYRVFGVRGEESYISFTIHSEAVDGGFNGRVLSDINDSQFTFASDGSYSIVFSAEKPSGDRSADLDGDWVQLDPDARMLIVRSYFLREPSAQNDPLVQVRIGIEVLDDVPPPPPLDDATLATRLRAGVAFLRQTTLGQPLPGAPSPAPFMGKEPNTVGEPWSFRNAGVDAAGAVDIFYSMGRWDLGPDDALVMRGTIPPSRFTNVMLWNRHMQTLEYAHRRSSLNSAQIAYEPDGSYTVVVAHRDPGVPNWLDTGGHRVGTIFWRYLLPETDPPVAECEVVPVDSLR